jgi:hypothetical protein
MIHVEVARHFNEDAFSYGLAQGMADRLRNALREVRCSEHDEEPSVRVSTEGVAQVPNDLHIEVSGCCDAAVQRTREIVEQVRATGGGGAAGREGGE